MKTLHEKSPCCDEVVYVHGRKRRKCRECGKTWSVWKRARGRKIKRVQRDLASRYVAREVLPMRVERRNQTRNQRQYALEKSRRWFAVHAPWPEIPDGPLVVIADGLVKYLDRHWHTWYFILVRSTRSDRAVILPSYHQEGTEIISGWRRAFENVPKNTRERIVALVSDGHRGLVDKANEEGWLIQRCHFHVLKRLQSQRSRWRKGRHQEEAEKIYACVSALLTETDEGKLDRNLRHLTTLKNNTTSREVHKVLRGFLRNYQDYRTYLNYPELNLPATNNTSETLVGLVERLAQQARGFRNPDTFNEWICVLFKTKKFIYCRAKRPQY